MNIKIFNTIMLIGIFALTSCKSKEEKVISNLTSLSERIDKHGNQFDAEDWDEAMEEWVYIHEDIQDCEFTEEQLRQLGIAEGRLYAVIATEGAKAISNELSYIYEYIRNFFSGFQEGLEENIDMEELEETEKEIADILEALNKEYN